MTNESRRALVELLLLAIYQDDHLSLLEDAALEKALATLGWEAGGDNDLCITTAFAAARGASSCEVRTEDFLRGRVKILRSEGNGPAAFALLGKVLASDGLAASEGSFLYRLGKLLLD